MIWPYLSRLGSLDNFLPPLQRDRYSRALSEKERTLILSYCWSANRMKNNEKNRELSRISLSTARLSRPLGPSKYISARSLIFLCRVQLPPRSKPRSGRSFILGVVFRVRETAEARARLMSSRNFGPFGESRLRAYGKRRCRALARTGIAERFPSSTTVKPRFPLADPVSYFSIHFSIKNVYGTLENENARLRSYNRIVGLRWF